MRPLLLALPFFAMIAFAQSPDSKLTQGADNPSRTPPLSDADKQSDRQGDDAGSRK